MSIISINTNTTGLVGSSVDPRRCTMVSTDSLATVTSPGYINQNVLGQTVLPTDVFDVYYNYNTDTQSGDFAVLKVSINGGVVTLFSNSQDLFATVTLTSDEIKGMYAAPELIVPAPGPDLMLVLQQLVMIPVFGTAAYAAGGVVNVQYGSTVHGDGYWTTTDTPASAFQQTSTIVINVPCDFPTASSYSWTLAQIGNQGLYLSNQTGAFTTGDGPLLCHLWYSVVRTA